MRLRNDSDRIWSLPYVPRHLACFVKGITMSNETMSAARRIHPLTAVAAIAVTALSLTGIAAMTGHLGGPHAEMPSTAATATAPAMAQVAAPLAAPAANQANGNAADPVKPVPALAHRPAAKAHEPVNAGASEPVKHATAQAKPIDRSGATVLAIERIDVSSSNSGVGAVVGGVVGGVAGHQVGGGHGKDVATVLGAVGGAVAGNAIEKYERKVYRYDVQVRTGDGSTRTLHYTSPPSFSVGERISLNDAG